MKGFGLWQGHIETGRPPSKAALCTTHRPKKKWYLSHQLATTAIGKGQHILTKTFPHPTLRLPQVLGDPAPVCYLKSNYQPPQQHTRKRQSKHLAHKAQQHEPLEFQKSQIVVPSLKCTLYGAFCAFPKT